MNDNNDYYQKLLNSKDREINDLQNSLNREKRQHACTSKLAETRYLIVEALRREVTSVQTWNKVLFLLSVIFLAFIIVMFKYYSDQRREIESFKPQQAISIDTCGYEIQYVSDTIKIENKTGQN